MISRLLLAVLLVVALGGCTFVKVSPEGEQVRASEPAAVASCERIGRTNALTRDKVWVFKRNPDKVTQELTDLARDDAADMGGTDVAPLGEQEGGQQSFGIYRCPAAP